MEPEICPHMPDDPDVTECHFCGFKVKLNEDED